MMASLSDSVRILQSSCMVSSNVNIRNSPPMLSTEPRILDRTNNIPVTYSFWFKRSAIIFKMLVFLCITLTSLPFNSDVTF
jgi:hypothetical protein